MSENSYRKQMVEVCVSASKKGLIPGSSGNVSVRIDDNKMLITATSQRYEGMKPKDLVLCDFDGNVLKGDKMPSSEWRMHAQIYKAYKSVNAVFHAHSPYATAFSLKEMDIPDELTEVLEYFGGTIKCTKYIKAGTEELGKEVVEKLNGAKGCLIGKHGTVAIGENLEKAYSRSEYIENAAMVYILSRII